MESRLFRGVLGFVAAGVLQLGVASVAQANLINVDVLADDAGGSLPGCSLREALRAANGTPTTDCGAAGADDVLELASGTHQLSIGGTGENAALTGDLDVTNNVVIRPAPGAGPVTIDGGDLDRAFELVSGDLGLEDLTISNGTSSSGSALYIPIGAARTANLTDVVISSNTANANGGGGGIFVGGGGVVNLQRGLLTGNENTGGRGGAVLIESGTLNASDSAFVGNTATGGGGAISASGFSSSQTYSNVLIAGNKGFGGGINFDGAKNVTITATTIIGNESLGDGGGIQSVNGDNDITIAASVIAGNTAADIGDDCRMLGNGNVSAGYNVTGDASDCAALTTGPGDLSGTIEAPLAAKVAAPKDNGGPLPTAALKKGSPALDIVPSDSPLCLDADARGAPRAGLCDAGSYELRLCAKKPVNIFGTPGDDLIQGTPGRDVLLGFAGADVFKGGDGADAACGGSGKDQLKGGAGRDRLLGGGDRDKIDGGKDKDTCKGGPGKDRIRHCEKR